MFYQIEVTSEGKLTRVTIGCESMARSMWEAFSDAGYFVQMFKVATPAVRSEEECIRAQTLVTKHSQKMLALSRH